MKPSVPHYLRYIADANLDRRALRAGLPLESARVEVAGHGTSYEATSKYSVFVKEAVLHVRLDGTCARRGGGTWDKIFAECARRGCGTWDRQFVQFAAQRYIQNRYFQENTDEEEFVFGRDRGDRS